MITPGDFLGLLDDKEQEKVIRFGKIEADYTSGRPSIVFDGTDTPSVKKYPYAASYTPAPNDRVMIIKNVIICKII